MAVKGKSSIPTFVPSIETIPTSQLNNNAPKDNATVSKAPLLLLLHDLMAKISMQKDYSTVSTVPIVKLAEKESGLFERDRHQDSHQFYMWLMDSIDTCLKPFPALHEQFRQQFYSIRVTRVRCNGCGTVTERQEPQVDLSLKLPEPNVSLNYCIDSFTTPQLMTGRNKFNCDVCKGLQVAEMSSIVKKYARFLSVQLCRFVYDERKGEIKKLDWMVAFPRILRLGDGMVDQWSKKYKKNKNSQSSQIKLISQTGDNVSSSLQQKDLSQRLLSKTNPSQMEIEKSLGCQQQSQNYLNQQNHPERNTAHEGSANATNSVYLKLSQQKHPQKSKVQVDTLSHTKQDANNSRKYAYNLASVLIHIGRAQNEGHYVTYIRLPTQWWCYNDEEVSKIEQYLIQSVWGYRGMAKCAYMLFYQRTE